MNRKDPRLRIALQLQRCLVQRSEVPLRERQRTWAGVEEQASLVLRRLSRTQRARRRGWQSAANLTEVSAVDALKNLQYTVANAVLHLENRGDPPPVRVSELYQELDQLETEFGPITLDPKQQLLAVITDPIELEDIPLDLRPAGVQCRAEWERRHPGARRLGTTAQGPAPARGSPR